MGSIFDAIGDFFFGSDDIEVPQLSAEQQRNLNLQNEALQQQADLSRLLLPILLQEDFDITLDEAGNILTINAKDPTELEKSTEEIQNRLAQESLKALKGELPIPKQVNKDFAEAREILEESLRKTLGPDFASSTPGADALLKFDEAQILTNEGIAFGRLSELEGLGLARASSGREEKTSDLQQVLASLGIRDNSITGLQRSEQLSQFDRSLRAQVDIANQSEGFLGKLIAPFAQGAGAGTSAAITSQILNRFGAKTAGG